MKVNVRKPMFYIEDMTCDATLDGSFKTAQEAIDYINCELIPHDVKSCMACSAYKVYHRVSLGYGGFETVAKISVNHSGHYSAEDLIERIDYLDDCQDEDVAEFGKRNPYVDNEIHRLSEELAKLNKQEVYEVADPVSGSVVSFANSLDLARWMAKDLINSGMECLGRVEEYDIVHNGRVLCHVQ